MNIYFFNSIRCWIIQNKRSGCCFCWHGRKWSVEIEAIKSAKNHSGSQIIKGYGEVVIQDDKIVKRENQIKIQQEEPTKQIVKDKCFDDIGWTLWPTPSQTQEKLPRLFTGDLIWNPMKILLISRLVQFIDFSFEHYTPHPRLKEISFEDYVTNVLFLKHGFDLRSTFRTLQCRWSR